MNPIDPEQRIRELIAEMLRDITARKAAGMTVVMVPENPDDSVYLPLVTITIRMLNKDNIEKAVSELMRDTVPVNQSH